MSEFKVRKITRNSLTAGLLAAAVILPACGDKEKAPSKPKAAQIAEEKAARQSLDSQAKLAAGTVLRVAQRPDTQVLPTSSNKADNNIFIRKTIDSATVNGKVQQSLYPQQPQISVTYKPANRLVAISANRSNSVTTQENAYGNTPNLSTDVVLRLKKGTDVKSADGNLDLNALSKGLNDAKVIAATASIDKEFPKPDLKDSADNGVYFSESKGVVEGGEVNYIAVPSDLVASPTYTVPDSIQEVTAALNSTSNALAVAIPGLEQPLQP